MTDSIDIMDWASMYLADEIPVEEFCAVFERWWHGNRARLPEAETAAATPLVYAVAWYSEGSGACIPAGKAHGEPAVRGAVVDFLEFMLRNRRPAATTPPAGHAR